MRKYASARDNRIDTYINTEGVGRLLDVLFLSHIHYDHVSGIERLLASRTGLTVDTIVLPLLNVADRLIAYARATAEEPGIAGDDFYRALIIDPTTTLSRFGPRQIIFVRRGNPDGGPPGSKGPDDSGGGDRHGLEIYGRRGEWGLAWKLIGSGRADQVNPSADTPGIASSRESVTIIDDTLAFAMPSAPSSTSAFAEWLLAPFVDPTVSAKRHKFMRALADSRSMTVPTLEKWLEQVSNVHDLVVNGLPDLATAYGAIEPDFNITSLCLYSGPRPVAHAVPKAHGGQFGSWSKTIAASDRIAWLGTGDAALASTARSTAFSRHYGQLLAEVITLTLPHHGSDHNLSPKLIKSIGAELFVAAADQFAKWRHPGSRTVQVVAELGRFVSTVTSAHASEIEEVGVIL